MSWVDYWWEVYAELGLNGGMTLESILEFLTRPLIPNLDLTLYDVIKAIFVVVLVVVVSKIVRSIVKKGLGKATMVDEGSENAIATIVYYAMLALGLTWAFSMLGLNSTGLAVFTGALGLGVGLGFQDIAKNFISGIIMLLSKTIKPGDVISVDDMTGRVEDVGMYSSRMKTVLDATVIVPNSQILNQEFVNWTHDRAVRMVEIPVGVHYDSDLDVVMRVLHEAAKENEKILDSPAARVLLISYGNSSVDFVARVWTDEVMYYQRVISSYYLAVWRKFKEEGVIIPYPQQDLYLKEMPEDFMVDQSS